MSEVGFGEVGVNVVATEQAGFRPVLVTAHIAGSVVLDLTYGLVLDGIATAGVRSRLRVAGQRASALDGGLQTLEPVDYDLPFARCVDTTSGQWHWLAGGAWIPERAGVPVDARSEVRWLSSRLDVLRARAAAWKVPANALGSRGRFRPVRRPVLTQVASRVCWRAVADPVHLRAVLGEIPAVGGRRGAGEGQVIRWEVEEAPEQGEDGDAHAWAHLTPEGVLSRPIPVGCAARVGVGFQERRAGLRPPVFHPARQRLLATPL